MPLVHPPPSRPRPARQRLGGAVAVAALVGVALASTTAVAPPASAQPDEDPEWSTTHSPAVLVDQMTGVDATTDTSARWRITGTDLGIMWDDGNGGVLTAFGDTFGDWPPGPAGGGGGGDWRSNVLLRSTDRDLSDGMSFDWALEDRPGHAGEIVPSLKQPGVEFTTIPTAGIEVDGVQYLAYMSVRQWGPAGLWDTNFSRIAYSTDGGTTWNSTDGPTWENPGAETSSGRHPFQMMGFERHDGMLYVFGTPNGRDGAAHVARVAEDAILDKAAYEYWTGAEWESGAGADVRAEPIIDPDVSELSVRHDDHSGKWLITYLDQDLDVVLRTADAPTGPWAPKQVIASFADYPALYGSYFHPWSTDGELYLAMSQWVPYNAYLLKISIDRDGNIIRPNLVRDGGFERQPGVDFGGSVPAAEPWVAEGGARVVNEFTQAFAGVRHGWVGGAPGRHAMSQTVAVEPDTAYAASMWVRTTSSAVDGSVWVRAGDGAVLAEATATESGTWTRLDLRFDSGPHRSVDLVAGVDLADGAGAGDAMAVDDAAVVATASADEGDAAFTATVAARCVAGRLMVEVTATNDTDETARMRVESDLGSRQMGVARPGASVSTLLNTRTDAVPAGSMTVVGGPLGGPETRVTVPHGALSCR